MHKEEAFVVARDWLSNMVPMEEMDIIYDNS